MSNEYIGVADQERESMAENLALAERELSAFVTAVHQLLGGEQAWQAGDIWIEELERTRRSSMVERLHRRIGFFSCGSLR